MPEETLDPEIARARAAQAASAGVFDIAALPPAEGRARANKAAQFFNDGKPDVHDVRDLIIPGPAGPLRARLYRPSADAKSAVLYAHGGGWFHCDVDTHDRVMRMLARESGAAILGVDYRLAPEHPFPAAFDDLRAAWAWLAAQAGAYGFAANKPAVAGDSAGANLALSLSLAERDDGRPQPAALALFYGCFAPRFETDSHRRLGDGRFGLTTARMRWYWRNYADADFAAVSPYAAPLNADLDGLPPTYLSLAALDPLSDDTRDLAARMAQQGIAHRLTEWPGACHGFLQMTRDAAIAREALSDAARFLSAQLG